MSSEKALFAIAAIVLVVAVLSLGFTYYSVSSFKEGFLTGHVTANGTIAINITSSAAINFTTSTIDWKNGTFISGKNFAVLSTSSNDVVNGTWGNQANGFVVQNIGNVNVSVHILFGKNAAEFIGGGAGANPDPIYQYNVTNDEAGSCAPATGFTLGVFYDVNDTASPGTYVCHNLSFDDGKDEIMIDIKLGIPYDAPATSANLTDQMMVTATQSAS